MHSSTKFLELKGRTCKTGPNISSVTSLMFLISIIVGFIKFPTLFTGAWLFFFINLFIWFIIFYLAELSITGPTSVERFSGLETSSVSIAPLSMERVFLKTFSSIHNMRHAEHR